MPLSVDLSFLAPILEGDPHLRTISGNLAVLDLHVQLKRSIDAKLAKLYQAYEEKKRSLYVDPHEKRVPHIVRNYIIRQSPVGLPA